jgi:protein-S-isoprenylcysteine O-methyltransferase Ste14
MAAERVLARDAGLTAERRNARAGKSWDKPLVGFLVLVGPMATWITAGLDHRHDSAAAMPVAASIGAAVVAATGSAVIVWAMRANTFFSAVVRIQTDRGHSVVSTGPYRFIRHPGYAGMSAFMLATPVILGSCWAFVPAAITLAVTVLRTALEDRTLRTELPGYAEYASRVRSRLVPLVW